MKDAFGGVLNIVLIVVFLVIVSGILGLLVNYTKAFRMKNIVISTIEKYDGASGCFNSSIDSDCKNKIIEGANQIGYHPSNLRCSVSDGFTKSYDYFCYKKVKTANNNYVYTVITQVDIDIPIINRMMGLSIFQVHGDTRIVSK